MTLGERLFGATLTIAAVVKPWRLGQASRCSFGTARGLSYFVARALAGSDNYSMIPPLDGFAPPTPPMPYRRLKLAENGA